MQRFMKAQGRDGYAVASCRFQNRGAGLSSDLFSVQGEGDVAHNGEMKIL